MAECLVSTHRLWVWSPAPQKSDVIALPAVSNAEGGGVKIITSSIFSSPSKFKDSLGYIRPSGVGGRGYAHRNTHKHQKV